MEKFTPTEPLITVYFESDGYAEQVATFEDEELYIMCVPVLEKQAKLQGKKLTETVNC